MSKICLRLLKKLFSVLPNLVWYRGWFRNVKTYPQNLQIAQNQNPTNNQTYQFNNIYPQASAQYQPQAQGLAINEPIIVAQAWSRNGNNYYGVPTPILPNTTIQETYVPK